MENVGKLESKNNLRKRRTSDIYTRKWTKNRHFCVDSNGLDTSLICPLSKNFEKYRVVRH